MIATNILSGSELISRLEDKPSDWNRLVKEFATSTHGLTLKNLIDGHPAYVHQDGRMMRIGERDGSYTFSETHPQKPTFIDGDFVTCSARELVDRINRFARTTL